MTADKFLKVALSQVGIKETPVNQIKYNDWYYGRHVSGAAYPWCVVFVCWCANQVGVLGELIPKTASSSTMYRWFRDHTGITKTPKAGDIGFLKGTTTPASHTFIVYGVSGNSILTIEGNLDDGVVRRTRKLTDKDILGFGIVPWDDSKVMFVDNVDYEGLNVRYIGTNKKTGKVLPIATQVLVQKFDGNKAILSKETYVDKRYLSEKKPAYKVVTGADSQGLNVRPRYIGGIMGKAIACLKNGTRVKVYQTKGKWSKVSPDANAWCYSEYLR